MYRDDKQPSENVEDLAMTMHFVPPERYLDGDNLVFEYDPQIIKQCIDKLGKPFLKLIRYLKCFCPAYTNNEISSKNLETYTWFSAVVGG